MITQARILVSNKEFIFSLRVSRTIEEEISMYFMLFLTVQIIHAPVMLVSSKVFNSIWVLGYGQS